LRSYVLEELEEMKVVESDIDTSRKLPVELEI
jgi:hypothetical protein